MEPEYICFWIKFFPIISVLSSHLPVDIKLIIPASVLTYGGEKSWIRCQIVKNCTFIFLAGEPREREVYNRSFHSSCFHRILITIQKKCHSFVSTFFNKNIPPMKISVLEVERLLCYCQCVNNLNPCGESLCRVFELIFLQVTSSVVKLQAHV